MTEDPAPLAEQAQTFAAEMNEMLLASVTDDVAMVSSRAELKETLFVVGNQVEIGSHDESSISTLRGSRFPVARVDGVSLSAVWIFTPSSNGNWLKSSTSSFGLWVGDAPFVRLEVDASKPEGSWLQAHIHITAESRLLGYLKGIQGLDRTRLEKLHNPAALKTSGGVSFTSTIGPCVTGTLRVGCRNDGCD